MISTNKIVHSITILSFTAVQVTQVMIAECNAENWAGLSTTRCAEPHPPPVVDAGSLSRAASTAEPEVSLTACKQGIFPLDFQILV